MAAMSALLSFKWTAGKAKLTHFADSFLDDAVERWEITKTHTFGFDGCFVKQNTW